MMKVIDDPHDLHGLPRMLTSGEVAQALSVTSSTLCRWRSLGIGPTVYWLGPKSPRYMARDVVAWLDRKSA